MLSSIIKLPSVFLGAEFQMSAPISVFIAMLFGPEIYIIAGIIASFLSFFLGISNIYGVIVALVFRFGVIVFIGIIKNKNICLIFSGSFGSILSRIVLSKLLGVIFYESNYTCYSRNDCNRNICKTFIRKIVFDFK